MSRLLVFFTIAFVSLVGKASMIDINAGYLSDTMTTSSTVVTTRTNYDFALGIHLGSKKNYFIAISYGSLATSDQTTTTTTFASQDTGIKFGTLFGKGRSWAFSVTYNFIGKAAYKAGAATEVELRGTSLKSDLGYYMWLGESTALAFKFMYYAPAFIEQVSGSTITKVSYSRATVMPGMNFYWEY